MGKCLTNSKADRASILNDYLLLESLKENMQLLGIQFNGKCVFTRNMVARFFDADVEIIDNCVSENLKELTVNGYKILSKEQLADFINCVNERDEKDDCNTLMGLCYSAGSNDAFGVFDFNAFLDIAMLLIENENAEVLRNFILDVAIDLLNRNNGGSTKYIDKTEDSIIADYVQSGVCCKSFAESLRDCVGVGLLKYPLYVNRMNSIIFGSESIKGRKLLKFQNIEDIENVQKVKNLVQDYELLVAELIRNRNAELGKNLNEIEMNALFTKAKDLSNFQRIIGEIKQECKRCEICLGEIAYKQIEENTALFRKCGIDNYIDIRNKELVAYLQKSCDVLKRLKER